MATIKFDGIVGEARGAIGDTVYSRNQYGSYIKTRTTPTNPATAPQTDWRGRLAAAVALWQTLTQEERDMYYAQAKNFIVRNRVGDRVKINGYNLFIRQQLIISKINNEGQAYNPVAAFTDIYQLISLELNVTQFLVNITSSNLGTDMALTVKASPPRLASHPSFNPSECVIIVESQAEAEGPAQLSVADAYEAVHGPIAGLEGQLVTIGIQSFNRFTGQRSEDFFLSAIVGPEP